MSRTSTIMLTVDQKIKLITMWKVSYGNFHDNQGLMDLMPQKIKKQPKKIDKIKIKLPNNKYQPSVEELREEVSIPISPNELGRLLVRDYEIEYEK